MATEEKVIEVDGQQDQQNPQDPPTKRRLLYDAVAKEYDLGTYDEFENNLKDLNKRKAFYDAVGQEYDLGTYDEFQSQIGFSVKKKVGTLDFEKSSMASGNGLQGGESTTLPQEEGIPTISMYETKDGDAIRTDDIFGLVNKKSQLKEAVIPRVSGSTGGASVSFSADPEKLKESKELGEFIKSQGYDPDELENDFNGIPEDAFKIEGLSKNDILSDYKENPQLYKRKIGTIKWQAPLLDNMREAGVSYKSIDDAIRNIVAPDNSYANVRRNVKDIYKAIEQYGGDNKDEMLKNFTIDISKAYAKGGDEVDKVMQDERAKYLNENQLIGLQFLEDTDPRKAQGFSQLLIDPSLIQGDDNVKRGWEEKAKKLEQIGLGIQQSAVQEDINQLTRKYKDGREVTPQDAENMAALELKKESLTNKSKELNVKYPGAADSEIHSSIVDIIGRNPYTNAVEYPFVKLGHEVENTAEGVWSLASEPFRSEESSKLHQLAIAGEKGFSDIFLNIPSKDQILKSYSTEITPKLKAVVDPIINNPDLSDQEKYAQLYNALKQNPGEYARVPLKGSKVNINPASLWYSVSDLGATLLPFMAFETLTGGGATAGAARKLASQFTAAAATSFNTVYADAVKEGVPNPFGYALRVTAINSAAMAGAGTAGEIKKMLGTKTAIGELVNSMSDDAINALLNKKGTSAIKDFGKVIGKSFLEGAKTGAKFETLMAGAEIANAVIDKEKINPKEMAKKGLVGTLNFSLFGTGTGAKSQYRKLNELEGGSLLKASENPTDYLNEVQRQLSEKEITPEQYNQISENIKDAATVGKRIEYIDNDGNPLSEKKKAELLVEKLREYKLQESVRGDVPTQFREKVQKEIEKVKENVEKIYEPEQEDTRTEIEMPNEADSVGVGGDVKAKINKVADEYLYHGTGEGAFRRIREEGLTPQGEKYLYFADKEQYAKTYAQRKGNSFGDRVLRVKKSDAYLPDENTTGGDFKIKNKINPNDIEIKHNGKWIPIQEFADENIGIMPISKAVEQSLKEQPKSKMPNEADSVGVGGDVETKQQIENFGVNKADVEPVHSVISQVFNGLKKAGLTAAKTVGDWVGIGKGSEKPYSLKIGDKEVQVKNTQPEVVNGFYSPLEKVITDSKFDKLPAKQWAEKYANSEEAKWTGLKDWLAQQQGSVSKADIQQFLKDNRIQVVEVVNSGKSEKYYQLVEEQKNASRELDILESDLDNWSDENYKESRDKKYELNDKIKELSNQIKEEESKTKDTKFENYQLEGEKENYKEVLVTMPSREPKIEHRKTSDYSIKVDSESTFTGQRDVIILKDGKESGRRYGTSATDIEIINDHLSKLDAEDLKQKKKEGQFKSSHFDEPNILVHLRMNTRTDAEGKKVLFLEEVQSDWGQKGKKEGFGIPKYTTKDVTIENNGLVKIGNDNNSKNYFIRQRRNDFIVESTSGINVAEFDNIEKAKDFVVDKENKRQEQLKHGVPTAPFVTDTNAWTKLGLKVALKEAVKQGADKIAWTTGEQQNSRYDLSKHIDNLEVTKDAGGWKILGKKGGETVTTKFANTPAEIEAFIGKDMAEKITTADIPEGKTKTYSGVELQVGGKGMKGFYGSTKENSLGIVGNVAKSLFKQEPKTTEIITDSGYDADRKNVEWAKVNVNVVKVRSGEREGLYFVELDGGGLFTVIKDHYFEKAKEAEAFGKQHIKEVQDQSKFLSTQHSIDITPELKASVEGGQPLFKDAEAQYRIESGKNIIEAIKDFNQSKNKARATVALTHEIMHPTVVSIIDGAKEGNEVGTKHTETIVNEFNKANPNSKVTVEDLIKGNDAFKDGTTSKQYRQVQEFIAKSWEKYHTEGGKGFSESFQKVLEQITKAFQSVYESITGKQLTPELKKMFDDILGKEASIKYTEAATGREVLTKEAEDLLKSVGEGSMPTFITKNLEKIAADNGIEITGKMSAVDVINALKEKKQSIDTNEPTTEVRKPLGEVMPESKEQGVEATVPEGTEPMVERTTETTSPILETKTEETVVDKGAEPPKPPTETVEVGKDDLAAKKKRLLNRLVGAKFASEESKVEMRKDGLDYIPKSQSEAESIAKEVLDSEGIDSAVLLARANEFGGDVNTLIQTEALNRLKELEDKASTSEEKQSYAVKFAELGIELDKWLRKKGQSISALKYFYKKSPLGIEMIERAKRKEEFEGWAKKKEQSWEEFFNELIKEPEFEKVFKENVSAELKKERAEARKERVAKVDKFFDEAIDKFKGGATYSTIIPPKVITLALEGMKKAYHAGEAVAKIIQDAVDFISKEIGTDSWDKDKFRKEWQPKLSEKGKKILSDEEVKLKILDKFRKKLKGLSEAEKQQVVIKSFAKLVENGALDYADFRKIIAEVTGRADLTDSEAKYLRELVNQTNKVDDVAKLSREERTDESFTKYRIAELNAAKAQRELNILLSTKPEIINRLNSIMQLNTLGIPALVNNPIYNLVNQSFLRFPIATVNTMIDYGIAGMAKAMGKDYVRETDVIAAQKEFFNKLGFGAKESLTQFITGLNRMDYTQKEVKGQNIRPFHALRDLSKWVQGKKNLTKSQIFDKVLQGTVGIPAEIVARALNLGDKPMRFGAEGAQASVFAKALGLKDIDYKLFIEFPREEAYRKFKAEGLSDAEAAKKADYIRDSIVKEGERSTFQQDNMLNDLLNSVFQSKVFGGANSGVGNLVKSLTISPYIKIPSNAYWSYYNIVNPEIAILQSMIYGSKAALKSKNPNLNFKIDKDNSSAAKDLREARYWFGHAVVGIATRAVITSMVSNGIFRSSNTKDDTKKEREGEQFYEQQGSINVNKLWAWLKGKNPDEVKDGLLVNNRWFGHWGTVGNTIAKQYEDATPEQKEAKKNFWDAAFGGMELETLKELDQGVFANTAAIAGALENDFGLRRYGANVVNMFTNIIHPAAFAQQSRAELPYYTKTKADSFLEELGNSMLARSSWARKLTGKYPPSKITPWGDEANKKDTPLMRMFGISRDNRDNFGQSVYDDYRKTENTKFLPPSIKPEINKVKLNSEETKRLEQLVGKARKQLVAPYVNDMAVFEGSKKKYSELSDEEKIKNLEILYEQGFDFGKAQFLREYPQYDKPEQTTEEKVEKRKDRTENKALRSAAKRKQVNF